MRRRDFITLLGGAAAWPLAARSEQGERMRRIGVLSNLSSDDQEGQTRNAAFLQGLQELGWTVGRNVRIDYRWGLGNAEFYRRHAADLVALGEDTILATSTPAVLALQQATHTVPIVFVQVIDPVGAGMIASLAQPGGNRKLTPHQRQEAIQRLTAGETQADVARTYNVDPTTIGRLLGDRPFLGEGSEAALQ